MGEDNIEVAIEIKHFSHEHDLELMNDLEITKNVMGVNGQYILHFIDVLNANFFFAILMPNCLQKRNTFVKPTQSPFKSISC